ncbi:hypothetical protein AS888_21605 [Peribacillus simplex]|uniref:Uncharacterized protein n=1 Tax=Peribacillus simplex TaxID=1478 RepID=A0A109MX40_9BACI|nr:hypothetical protein AS888_21605 [Peribacillus simplex]
MIDYLKFRYKSYIIIFSGFLIGAILSKILFINPDNLIAITCFLGGFLIGECVMINKWLKNRPTNG